MASTRKYAGLPDLDPSPDIYETPELTDDTSTHPVGVPEAANEPLADTRQTSTTLPWDSLYDDLGENEDKGIDRQRLDPDEARTHFLPADEREQHRSSRIGTKRGTYRSSDRKRRKGDHQSNGIVNGVDVSSDEEGESLERKIARLRREIAEVKDEFEQSKDQDGQRSLDPLSDDADSLDNLGIVLEGIKPLNAATGDHAADRLTQNPTTKRQRPSNITDGGNTSLYHEPAPDQDQPDNQALSKISDFESRLVMIETALGIDDLPLPTQDDSMTKPVFLSLDALSRQLNTLSTSTDTSLDTISRRVRQLTQDTEKLEQARKSAKQAQEALRQQALSPTAPNSRADPTKEISKESYPEDPELTAKVNALYGTLSTIESLAPMLPSVLDRLRSLRALHADAATASETLTQVESRQEGMKEELESWRKGLEKVEEAMEQGEQAMKGNTEVVEGWVKELEKRLDGFEI